MVKMHLHPALHIAIQQFCTFNYSRFNYFNSYTFSTMLYIDSIVQQISLATLQITITIMAVTTKIAPNDIIPALVHIQRVGDGQTWPLASAGIVVAVAATPQPR
jgi:hypothetical protein